MCLIEHKATFQQRKQFLCKGEKSKPEPAVHWLKSGDVIERSTGQSAPKQGAEPAPVARQCLALYSGKCYCHDNCISRALCEASTPDSSLLIKRLLQQWAWTYMPARCSTWQSSGRGSVQASIELYAGRELQLKIAASWTHKFPPTYCTAKPQHPLQKWIQCLCADKYVLNLHWWWRRIALCVCLCAVVHLLCLAPFGGLDCLVWPSFKIKSTSCNGKVCKFIHEPIEGFFRLIKPPALPLHCVLLKQNQKTKRSTGRRDDPVILSPSSDRHS